MWTTHNEVPFRLRTITPPGPKREIYDEFKEDTPEMRQERYDDLLELADDYSASYTRLKEENFDMSLTLKRLIALRDARDHVRMYVKYYKTEQAESLKKKADQFLDEYYLDCKRIEWRTKYPEFGKETFQLYAKLLVDLEKELFKPDFGPFS